MSDFADDEIIYRGETIKLTKPYNDFDDYKEDPDNLDPTDYARVGKLVETAPIAASYGDRWQMLQAVSNTAFPGYGHWQFGDMAQEDGSVLSGFGIEIPHADRARILVFRSRGGDFGLVDDFVVPSDPDAGLEDQITSVALADGKLIYADFSKRPVLTREIAPPPR